MSTPQPPTDHATQAAAHILAMVAEQDPTFRPSPRLLRATTRIVVAVAAALTAAGGAR